MVRDVFRHREVRFGVLAGGLGIVAAAGWIVAAYPIARLLIPAGVAVVGAAMVLASVVGDGPAERGEPPDGTGTARGERPVTDGAREAAPREAGIAAPVHGDSPGDRAAGTSRVGWSTEPAERDATGDADPARADARSDELEAVHGDVPEGPREIDRGE